MASAKNKNDPTVEEIVSLLKRTSLPTIVVEGSDDIIVYRRIEDQLQHLAVSILPVGGRLKVLEVFRRRAEYNCNVKVAYIVDQDVWINDNVPAEYQETCLVLTSGYSVENDVIVDGKLWTLLTGSEVANYDRELQEFCRWYALALNRHLADSTQPISLHPTQVLEPAQQASLLSLWGGEQYPDKLCETLLADPYRLVRGKSLLALLVRHLSYKGREPRHSSSALLEWVATRPGQNLNRIKSDLEAVFT